MKKLFSLIRNQKGFSLTELVVGVGIMGIVSLGVMDITNNQQKIKNYGKVKAQENSIAKYTRLNLLTEQSCEVNFMGRSVPSNLTEVRDLSGRPVMEVGKTFGPQNDSVTIEEISLRTIDGAPAAEGDGLVFIDLRMSRNVQGGTNRSYVTSFILRVRFSAAGTIEDCNAAVGDIDTNVQEGFCSITDGVWDIGTQFCNYSCPAHGSGVNNGILTNDCLDSKKVNDYDNHFIKMVGDNIIGLLSLGSNNFSSAGRITTNTFFCVGPRCRNFNQSMCTTNMIGRNVLADGTLVCTGPFACANNQYFQGFDGSGNMVCQPLRFGVCSNSDYYVKDILTDGTVLCEELPSPVPPIPPSSGQYIRVIPSSGTPITRSDDLYLRDVSCSPGQFVSGASGTTPICGVQIDRHVYGASCPAGQAINSFDSGGNPSCLAIE